ncbi:ABC transporter ATP-binding protein [Desulfosporosinus lacus]|uniref:NitT/TauT family transport system ATP-binding protein n=1 Tax=Desulfosporosinus lacus DSM 15449 TaxID=1121420 RepID=A0A1M5Z4V7_9FIRM|nr:ABC transporter ATP-binding protein [Desulfosporosinus lacus]SHI19307.1 NitT/TauT family transport system ATP-binding protein [Desulfosporosinus lacus DSM 15449]
MNDHSDGLLIIDHLHKSYCHDNTETEVLKNVTFRVGQGEIVGVVGPSGCGKSTLLHLVAGFDQDYRGDIAFCGQKITCPATERGMVFQSPQLFSWLKIKDNIAFGPKRQHMAKEDISAQTRIFLERVGMLDFLDYYPEQLSGGMQQRVALARALIMKPKLLLMDEPFSALDYQSRLEMQRLTLKLWEEYKPSILLVTHDIEEALLLADRIIVLSKGPGEIIRELSVNFDRPRDLSLIKSLSFHQLKSQILDQLSVLM